MNYLASFRRNAQNGKKNEKNNDSAILQHDNKRELKIHFIEMNSTAYFFYFRNYSNFINWKTCLLNLRNQDGNEKLTLLESHS